MHTEGTTVVYRTHLPTAYMLLLIINFSCLCLNKLSLVKNYCLFEIPTLPMPFEAYKITLMFIPHGLNVHNVEINNIYSVTTDLISLTKEVSQESHSLK